MSDTMLTPIDSTAERIGELHAGIMGRLKTSLDDALEIGRLLSEKKLALAHGEWLPWVATLSFSGRTARNYARLYAERDQLKLATVANLADAYKLLAAPRTDEVEDSVPVMTEAIALLKEAATSELADDSLPLSYWQQAKAEAEEAVRMARDYALDAERRLGECLIIEKKNECLVPWGRMATANGHSSDIGYWYVTILPSDTEPFVWITALTTDGGDHSPGTLDFTKKPIRGEYIRHVLRQFRIPVDEAHFEITETDERHGFDPLIWRSREEWFEDVVSGRRPS